MSHTYYPFPLDKWVSRLYKSIGIYNPEDIEERKIAKMLGIHLTYSDKRSFARDEGNFKLININKYLDKKKQREIFYHELCHILRHSIYQYKIMPTAFREIQEWDANHFARYAALPFHMLKFFDFKSPTLISELSNTFKISEDICQYRVDHIYRNARPKKAYNVLKG
ncbi:ImmA/IrrE family metallo-endopeptidase [Robertmurraya massiliosenegalensis]|uniref:ImmA/IrrE family metallo-endopeptidase n=1 Tax=Robertmurraya TaxID=2837507 RepID=UPI0039A5B533